jgi:hypothetical protein
VPSASPSGINVILESSNEDSGEVDSREEDFDEDHNTSKVAGVRSIPK